MGIISIIIQYKYFKIKMIDMISEYNVNALDILCRNSSKDLKLRVCNLSRSFYEETIRLMDNSDYEIINEIDDELIINEYKEIVDEVGVNMYDKLINNNPPFSICLN